MTGFVPRRAVPGLLLASALLAACSGGSSGDGSPGPTATAPAITAQPADASVVEGEPAAFDVAASGTAPLAYQWESSPDGAAWSDLTGATAAHLAIATATLAQDATRYRARVTNAAGSVTSNAARLTVAAAVIAPAITTEPADATVTAPATATFTVVASGTSPAYAWSVSDDEGLSWKAVDGGTAATLEVKNTAQPMSGYLYRVHVSNSAGAVDSRAASLTVFSPVAPTVTLQPEPITVVAGDPASFTAAATGDPAPTVQWQSSTDGTTWTDLPGATEPTYVTPSRAAADTCTRYRAVFTNAAGSVPSDPGLLGVEPVAVTPAYDGFDYTLGTFLSGATGGTGWSGPWKVTQQGPSSVITGASSGAIVAGLGYTDGAGRVLLATGGAWQEASAIFYGQGQRPTTSDAGTKCTSRWTSFLMKHATGPTSIDYVTMTLGQGWSFGSPALLAGVGGTSVFTGCFYCSTGGSSSVIPGFGADGVAFVLVRTDFSETGADTIVAWANPPLAGPLPAPGAKSSNANYAAVINGVTLAWGDYRSHVYDEVRMGMTRAEVTPFKTGP